MAQIFSITDNQENETINFDINDKSLDFQTAKQMAKDKAFEICDNPMILSWKNGKTGKSYPDYKCGETEKPFWIAYAEGRGANLTINFNEGEYIFKVLKM
jgi:hypothetical protein